MDNLIEQVIKFRDERDWEKFHNPKDLAISLTIEATELLEKFQWKTSKESLEKDLEGIKEELADIFIYALTLANDLDLDVEEIVKGKLEKNHKKYPITKSYGNKSKYTEL